MHKIELTDENGCVLRFDAIDWELNKGLTPPYWSDDEFKATVYGSSIYNILTKKKDPFKIKRVIFHDPATIVFWDDGSKTVVKCMEGDTYSKEVGLAMCISKKMLGDKFHWTFNHYLKEIEIPF